MPAFALQAEVRSLRKKAGFRSPDYVARSADADSGCLKGASFTNRIRASTFLSMDNLFVKTKKKNGSGRHSDETVYPFSC